MFNMFKKTKELWVNPVEGEVIKMTEVADEVFSSKMMGDGFAVVPTDSKIYSPLAGQVVKVFKTKHAILINGDTGLEVIVHVGLGTVELKGEGFEVHVEEGQHIEAGQHLITVDLEYVKSQEKSTVSPIIITNMDQVKSIEISKFGTFGAKEEVCSITRV